MSENFICENCDIELDPNENDLWTMTDYEFERTGYDGVRDWVTETLTLKCEMCGHVAKYSSSWVADPETNN